jgi:two-component system alkaline phosphatase synthesis response regulator PhoP
MNYRILIVEDEDHIRENLKLNLELEAYEVVAVADGAKAIKAFKEQRFDFSNFRCHATRNGWL